MSNRRVRVGGDGKPLADNPFAVLVERTDQLPPGPQPPNAGRESRRVAESPAAPSFAVARTRKGGWPVSIEKRPGGKTVTLIRNVTGDAKALLSLLRKRCGAGGSVREGAIELQGDQQARIRKILDELAQRD